MCTLKKCLATLRSVSLFFSFLRIKQTSLWTTNFYPNFDINVCDCNKYVCFSSVVPVCCTKNLCPCLLQARTLQKGQCHIGMVWTTLAPSKGAYRVLRPNYGMTCLSTFVILINQNFKKPRWRHICLFRHITKNFAKSVCIIYMYKAQQNVFIQIITITILICNVI